MRKYDNLTICPQHNTKINLIFLQNQNCKLVCPACLPINSVANKGAFLNIDAIKYFDQWARRCIRVLDDGCRSMTQHKQLTGIRLSKKARRILEDQHHQQQLHLALMAFADQIKIFESNIAYISEHQNFSDLTHPLFLLDIHKTIHEHAQPTIQYLEHNLLKCFTSFIQQHQLSTQNLSQEDILVSKQTVSHFQESLLEIDNIYLLRFMKDIQQQIQLQAIRSLNKRPSLHLDLNPQTLSLPKVRRSQTLVANHLLTPQNIRRNVQRQNKPKSGLSEISRSTVTRNGKTHIFEGQLPSDFSLPSEKDYLSYIIDKMEEELDSLVKIKATIDYQEELIHEEIVQIESDTGLLQRFQQFQELMGFFNTHDTHQTELQQQK